MIDSVFHRIRILKGPVMKRTVALCALALAGALPNLTLAQGFSSGSTGADGALEVTTNTTLDMPPDGVFNFTTITVASGQTLRFNRNPLNTPVYLLATGDVTIAGTINVNGSDGVSNPPVGGAGGPGGFDGGMPGFLSVAPGAGYGPGAGKAGIQSHTATGGAGAGAYAGVSASASTNNGAAYGSPLLVPMLGGSGGGGSAGSPGFGGGGGGGAILIASDTRIGITGTLTAIGGGQAGSNGHGSGGAIRLLAPVVSGTGGLNVSGGNWSGIAGHGRIRIDTIDRRDLRFTFTPLSAVNVGSFMAVFPSPIPRLDILNAAGTAIPEGAADPVYIQLPFGSSPNRTVTVQVRNFSGVVPVRLVLTPDSGDIIVIDDQIDNTTVNPAQKVIAVTLPLNVRVHVGAWTR
jgi:hypothetical protein